MYSLHVKNGESFPKTGGRSGAIEMHNVATSGRIWLNGELVAKSDDFDVNRTKQFGFTKDVTLSPVNTLEIELQGKPGSFITVDIREAEPNSTVNNRKDDLAGWNMGDQIVLWWERQDHATEYIVYRSLSSDGLWKELTRETAVGRANTVDITPDARLIDLCYRLEALDAKGRVIRRYKPVCVPKFVEKQPRLCTRKLAIRSQVCRSSSRG
jgi:hypothetical protein